MRSATIGDEYPVTLRDGELDPKVSTEKDPGIAMANLTAPNMAALHSCFRESTVSSGRAWPVRVNNSKPARSGTKVGLGIDDPNASMALCAACAHNEAVGGIGDGMDVYSIFERGHSLTNLREELHVQYHLRGSSQS